MFVCTVKSSSIKFFSAILVSAAILVGMILLIPVIDTTGAVAVAALDYKGVKTVEEQVSFLENLGYRIDHDPVCADEVTVPEIFDSVYEKYNEIQKAQGLNLEKYKGKTVMRYTYAVDDESIERYATLLIYKNKIIAGDITTLGENGTVTALERQEHAETE